MRKIQRYHYEEVKEIERVFEKKLKQEGDGYLQLEQEGLEMKQRYEKQIQQIKLENEAAINGLLEEFKTNLRKVYVEFKQSEEFSSKLKNYYTKKLDKQETTHEDEVTDLKMQHYEEEDALRKEVHQKQNDLRENESQKKDAAAEKEEIHKQYEEAMDVVAKSLERPIAEVRFRALLHELRARILVRLTSGRLDPENCEVSAPPLLETLNLADQELESAASFEVELPNLNAARLRVHRRRSRVLEECPGKELNP